MGNLAAARKAMADSQLRPNQVHDERVIAAMEAVPREHFVDPARAGVAYADDQQPIAPGRYLLRPMTLGRLLSVARIAPADSVLEIGAGNGYATAVLSRLAGQVVAVETDAELADHAIQHLQAEDVENVTVVHADMTAGYAAGAPYGVILVNGAVETVPAALLDQLSEGGRLVCLYLAGGVGRARVYARAHGATGHEDHFDASGPLLPGFAQQKGFSF